MAQDKGVSTYGGPSALGAFAEAFGQTFARAMPLAAEEARRKTEDDARKQKEWMALTRKRKEELSKSTPPEQLKKQYGFGKKDPLPMGPGTAESEASEATAEETLRAAPALGEAARAEAKKTTMLATEATSQGAVAARQATQRQTASQADVAALKAELAASGLRKLQTRMAQQQSGMPPTEPEPTVQEMFAAGFSEDQLYLYKLQGMPSGAQILNEVAQVKMGAGPHIDKANEEAARRFMIEQYGPASNWMGDKNMTAAFQAGKLDMLSDVKVKAQWQLRLEEDRLQRVALNAERTQRRLERRAAQIMDFQQRNAEEDPKLVMEIAPSVIDYFEDPVKNPLTPKALAFFGLATDSADKEAVLRVALREAKLQYSISKANSERDLAEKDRVLKPYLDMMRALPDTEKAAFYTKELKPLWEEINGRPLVDGSPEQVGLISVVGPTGIVAGALGAVGGVKALRRMPGPAWVKAVIGGAALLTGAETIDSMFFEGDGTPKADPVEPNPRIRIRGVVYSAADPDEAKDILDKISREVETIQAQIAADRASGSDAAAIRSKYGDLLQRYADAEARFKKFSSKKKETK